MPLEDSFGLFVHLKPLRILPYLRPHLGGLTRQGRPHRDRLGGFPGQIRLEVLLVAGVNDSPEQARQLAALLEHRRMHVNLLHYNATGTSLSGRTFEASSPEAAKAFMAELRARRVVTHFRRPRGRDIDAACGQLRQRAHTS